MDALALYAKIVNDKAKHDRSPHVAIEARGELAFVVAVFVKTFFQELVGEDACFW